MSLKDRKVAARAFVATDEEKLPQNQDVMTEQETTIEVEPNTQEAYSDEEASYPLDKANLVLKISASLKQRLMAKAELEGVALNELASELLAEGLVLRAWEIMERKSTMRQPGSNNSNFSANNARNNSNRPQNYRNQNNGSNQSGGGNGYRNNRGNYSSGGSSNGRRANNYNQIMEDSANFLEYVRNQEKRQK